MGDSYYGDDVSADNTNFEGYNPSANPYSQKPLEEPTDEVMESHNQTVQEPDQTQRLESIKLKQEERLQQIRIDQQKKLEEIRKKQEAASQKIRAEQESRSEQWRTQQAKKSEEFRQQQAANSKRIREQQAENERLRQERVANNQRPGQQNNANENPYQNPGNQRKGTEAKNNQPDRNSSLRTLGLDASATTEEIESEYKRLARIYHPDLNMQKDPVEQQIVKRKMQDLNIAYELLMPKKS